MSDNPLLGPNDEQPVLLDRPKGSSEIVLVCEHASKKLPPALGNLGLGETALSSHIGWDIGALEVARILSKGLDAILISQAYSRLAYDCNRPPDSPAAVPEKSEIYVIPGNVGLSQADKLARAKTFYDPFHAAIESVLEERISAGRKPVLITIHSFTPVYFGARRDGKLGILHDTDPFLAQDMITAASKQGLDGVRRNYPYSAADGVTHTLERHGTARGIANAMIEIRNNLISTPAGQAEWGAIIEQLLRETMRMGNLGERQHG